ncbi:FkbM family methyltransferase [Pinirhizobacter soli]|uniref:FkbM family methyltransferase n=1 Tax=Pinirhizobacter soli TaxID=2786953 RepID=UPI00202AB32B|nr:FkbM family methyltransferase [Pinirhizobacter soli]
MDFEARLEHFYSAVVRPGSICVDVGAHEGRHAIPLARLVGPTGKIFAFEPLPRQNKTLHGLVEKEGLAGTVSIYPYALSTTEGETTFVVAEDAPAYSGLLERVYDSPTRLSRIDVQVRRLDSVLRDTITALDYIKIDTEGAEWLVIQGASGLITAFRPTITFEFGLSSYKNYEVDPLAVHDYFLGQNYIVFDILGKELDAESFASSSIRQEVWDYVAIPAERRDMAEALRIA